MSYRRLIFAIASTLAATPALAADRVWPALFGIGPCTDTLQACIDGATAGDTVIIAGDDLAFPDQYTLVDENIVIDKSLTLKGAAGIDAVFAPDRTILVDSLATAPIQVAIESLTLRRGAIRFQHRAATAGSIYRVERVRILDVADAFATRCGIAAFGPGIAPSDFRVFDNSIRVATAGASRANGICSVTAFSNVTIARNRVEAARGAMRDGMGLAGSGTATYRITGNSVLGDEFLNGIYVAQASNPFRYDISIDSNVVAGQAASDTEFGAGIGFLLGDAQLRIVNNTVVDGRDGIAIANFPDATVDGEIANNLVAFQRATSLSGLGVANVTVTNRNNLVFGNAADPFVAGPGTLTSNPQLISLRDPRPNWFSPAFNAGVNAALSAFSAFDVDGEPRIVYDIVDIGAYEENDDRTRTQLARTDNTSGNYVTLDPSQGVPYSTTNVLAATPQHVPGEAPADQNIGAWLSNISPAQWSIFNEDPLVSIPFFRGHSVMVVGLGRTGYIHDTTLATVVDQFSQLDHPQLNARPGAIAIATHAYDSGTTPAYHDYPIGLDYFGGRWYVRNEDSAPMPPTRRFHVVIAPEFTLNAWRATNALGSAVSAIRLEHPLLDDNACAAPLAGRADPSLPTVYNPAPFAVEYRPGFGGAAGHWYIAAQGAGATIPSGAAYNVMVDGSQANACRNAELLPLFANGFE